MVFNRELSSGVGTKTSRLQAQFTGWQPFVATQTPRPLDPGITDPIEKLCFLINLVFLAP